MQLRGCAAYLTITSFLRTQLRSDVAQLAADVDGAAPPVSQ